MGDGERHVVLANVTGKKGGDGLPVLSLRLAFAVSRRMVHFQDGTFGCRSLAAICSLAAQS
eukprot:7158284-Prorocentrum_lima.AAC.1